MFSRAVHETLDAVVAPVVRDAIIQDALSLARIKRIPQENSAIRSFASGPLRAVTERALGSQLAESVTDEILLMIAPVEAAPESEPAPTRRVPLPRSHRPPSQPGFRHDSSAPTTPRVASPPPLAAFAAGSWPPGRGSHIRPNSERQPDVDLPPPGMRPGASSSRPPAGRPPMEAPFVLVSTEDSALFQTLSEWFGGRARVCRVRSAAELVRHLDGAAGHRAIVILDGKSPSIRPAAVVVLLEEQPEVEVVLCRAAPATEQVVLAASSATERWLIYREPASLDHVAAECLRLVS